MVDSSFIMHIWMCIVLNQDPGSLPWLVHSGCKCVARVLHGCCIVVAHWLHVCCTMQSVASPLPAHCRAVPRPLPGRVRSVARPCPVRCQAFASPLPACCQPLSFFASLSSFCCEGCQAQGCKSVVVGLPVVNRRCMLHAKHFCR